MNANRTAIRVMKQAAAAPDRNDLSEQAERGQAVGRWLVDTPRARSLHLPRREKPSVTGGVHSDLRRRSRVEGQVSGGLSWFASHLTPR